MPYEVQSGASLASGQRALDWESAWLGWWQTHWVTLILRSSSLAQE